MEPVINRAIYKHLDSHDLFSPAQHGFRPGRSCETTHLTAVHKISDSLENTILRKLTQFYFTKTFDKVDHTSALRKKLACAGAGF